MRVESRPIRPSDDDYPEGLNDLERPPVIFVAGTLISASAVAVVGTRTCTRYGVDLAAAFGCAIAGAGWSVVSGMARGIDSHAHWGALSGDGHIVGVVASGLDVWYPAENRKLYRELLNAGGGLISEYPQGTTPDRWRFPARNRLIAAISSAVVVVEAGERGGALITARLAAEIGRPVFAVPADVDRPASVGCNKLIRDGAHPVLGPEDLIEELSLVLGPPRSVKESLVETPIPGEGADLGELCEIWDCTVGQALARVGRLEAAGMIKAVGDRYLPA